MGPLVGMLAGGDWMLAMYRAGLKVVKIENLADLIPISLIPGAEWVESAQKAKCVDSEEEGNVGH
jgi:hypothetical protein